METKNRSTKELLIGELHSKHWVTRWAAAALLLTCVSVAAQEFPSKPVRIVVPYPPAGSVDFVARVLQGKLQEMWRAGVVVDNRPGASGMIGSQFVARAEPDGYTLLLGGVQTHAMNAGVIRKMLYDPIRDFTPITQSTTANWILAAHPAAGVKTPEELVATVRANPDKYTYASSGQGSLAHLAFSTLAAELDLRVVHVPYKGIGPGINDAIGGQVHFVMGDQSTLVPHIKAGKLVGIAMTGNARSTLLPAIPTIAETVLPGFDMQAWQGIWGPPGMDQALARRINADIVAALKAPDTAAKLRASGVDPVGSTVDQFGDFARHELGRWTEAAKKARVEPE
jgi:tripartite-type tricarboxylate transporter receptor subunit TctC